MLRSFFRLSTEATHDQASKPVIRVRKMERDDVSAVFSRGMAEENFMVSLFSRKLSFWPEETLVAWLNHTRGLALVAEVDGKLAGFVFAEVNDLTRTVIWHNQMVFSEFEGLGLAKLLYDRMLELLVPMIERVIGTAIVKVPMIFLVFVNSSHQELFEKLFFIHRFKLCRFAVAMIDTKEGGCDAFAK